MPRLTTLAGAVVTLAALCLLAACAEPAPEPAAAAPSVTDDTVFDDGFDASSLDTVRWSSPAKPGLISVSDGTLTLAVTPADTEAGVEDRIDARVPQPFRELTSAISVVDATKPGPGGGALVVTENSGRTHQVFFGPSPDGPVAGVLTCAKSSCSAYDDYTPPTEVVPLTVGRAIPVRIEDRDSSIRFWVDGRPLGSVPAADANGLKGLAITVYGADGETWKATVDAVSLRG